MDNFEFKLLEQKVTVMQKEVSEVLGEMQQTIQAIAATYSAALQVAMKRLDALEKGPSTSVTNNANQDLSTEEIRDSGVEL